MIKAYFTKWKKKPIFSRITDVLFLGLIITLLFPQGRLAVGGFVNKIKSKVSNPALLDTSVATRDTDWQWTIRDLDGNDLDLGDFRGKVIFLNLWATWCPPCVGEMPEIQKMYDTFRDDPDMAIIAVSNESVEKIKSFVEKKKYDFPVYTTVSEMPAAFATRSIPTSFLIDKNGQIVIREVGAMNWGGSKMESMIRSLLEAN